MKTLFLTLALLMSVTSFAGTEGGGGDVVILPDGKVILADVFLDRGAQQPNNMPKQIALSPRLLLQIKVYTEFTRKLLDATNFLQGKSSDILQTFDVLGKQDNDLAFYSVADAAELNDFCASGGRKVYRLEDGHKVEQVACTSGSETFLVEPLFRKMNIIQQALLLFHERLTTFRDKHGGKSYQAIAGFTSGLYKFLEIAYEQQHGTQRVLNEEELNRMTIFYESVFELEYRNSDVPVNALDWHLHPFGGGMIRGDAEAGADTFVSSTSAVMEGARVDSGSSINETIVPTKAQIDKNVTLNRVLFNLLAFSKDVYIGESSKISKTTFNLYGNLFLDKNTVIENSVIKAGNFEAEKNLTFKKVSIDLVLLSNDSRNSNKIVNIKLKCDQFLIDGLINFESMEKTVPATHHLKFSYADFTIPTKCKGVVEDLQFNRDCVTVYPSYEPIPSEDKTLEMPGSVLKYQIVQDRIVLQKKTGNYNPGDVLVIDRSYKLSLSFIPYNIPGQEKNLSSIINGTIVSVQDSRIRAVTFAIDIYRRNELIEGLLENLKAQGATIGHQGYYYERDYVLDIPMVPNMIAGLR